ncbi:MAG TPA: efflux RND transporter periplasmic adaptor subunit [Rhizomicrobium sp.]|nr:efflux RND transporter periplasmic adaptor subunit [Rhizomicrobium sp.]
MRLSLSLLALLASASVALAQQVPAPAAPSVGVVVAKSMRMAPKMALPGTVVARNDSHLASEVTGRVAWVAEVGTVVKAGDVVARVDPTNARLELDANRANVAKLGAQLRYDRSQAQRMETLYRQSAIARATRDQAASTRDQDAAALAQAQAVLAQSQYAADHGEIRAPFPGRVVQRLINTGEYATPGKEIVRLVDTGNIEVSTQAPIDSVRFLQEGMQVTAMIEDKPVATTVRAIVPVGDIASRTIEVRLTLPSGAGLVGDAARVLIPSAQPRQVVAVPRDALVLREDNTYVFKVDKKDQAQRVAVETGAEDGAMVEVRGQVIAGDRVIVRGAERLETGQKVRAVLAS